MDSEKKDFFMMTVEIRILAAVLARISGRSIEERFSSSHVAISGLQYGILRSLSYESFTLSDLSRRFVLDPSTLVPVIDSLVRKGLITRSRDPNDRRRMPISLTEKGTELIRSVPLIHEDDLLYQCLGGMGEDKARDLLHLLREVVQRMPEGEEMLQSIASRLYVDQQGASTPQSSKCFHSEDESEHEHRRMIIRSNFQRRFRKRRSQ